MRRIGATHRVNFDCSLRAFMPTGTAHARGALRYAEAGTSNSSPFITEGVSSP